MIPGLNLIFQNAGCARLSLSRSHMYKYSSNMVGSECTTLLCVNTHYIWARALLNVSCTELGQKQQWFRCFGELNRCFAMWSSTTPLMQQKLVKEGIVSGIMYELEVYKDSPTSEVT